MLYAQGGLIAAVALCCFIFGYLAGMAGGGSQTAAQPAVAQPVTISGKLFYQAQPGQSTPDVGAVMILIPQEAGPTSCYPSRDYVPATLPPMRRILPCERFKPSGVSTFVPARTASINSRFQNRASTTYCGCLVMPRVRTGNDPELADMETLANYFSGVEELLGAQKYTWSTLEVAAGTTLAYDFGVDGG